MTIFKRTGVACQRGSLVGLTVAGAGSVSALAAPLAEADGGTPDLLAEALAGFRAETRPAPGEVRCILPADACESFVRVLSGEPSDREVRERCLRWAQEECGVDPAASDIHVSAYDFAGRRVGAMTVVRRGLVGEYVREASERGVRGVAFLSPVDALMALAGQEANAAGLSAFFHVDPDNSLVLILEEGVPVFFRGIRRKLEAAAEAADRYEAMRPVGPKTLALAPTAIGGIVDEFAKTLAFFKRSRPESGPLDRVTVTTGGLDGRPVAARLEEALGVKAAPAGPPADLNIAGALADEALIGDNWGQFALPAAVAAPTRTPPGRCLARVPGPLDKLLSPQAAAAAAVCALGLLLALWLAAAWTARAGLETRKAALEATRGTLHRELAERRSEHERRAQHRRAARMMLRMKEQGVFTAGLLATLGNERPTDGLRFERLAVEQGEDAASAHLVISLSPRLGAAEALAQVDRYVARLRRSPRFEAVSAPGQPKDGRDAAPARAPVEPTARPPEGESAETARRDYSDRFRFEFTAESKAPWAEEGKR